MTLIISSDERFVESEELLAAIELVLDATETRTDLRLLYRSHHYILETDTS